MTAKDLETAMLALLKDNPSVTQDSPLLLQCIIEVVERDCPPMANPWKVRWGPELTPDQRRMGVCRPIEVYLEER